MTTQDQSWKREVFEKAWHDPDFFERLVDPDQPTGPTCTAAGIDLNEDQIRELDDILNSDSVTLDVDWRKLATAHGTRKPWIDIARPWPIQPWRRPR